MTTIGGVILLALGLILAGGTLRHAWLGMNDSRRGAALARIAAIIIAIGLIRGAVDLIAE